MCYLSLNALVYGSCHFLYAAKLMINYRAALFEKYFSFIFRWFLLQQFDLENPNLPISKDWHDVLTNYKNFLWACWPLSQNLTTGPCSNQLQRPPPLLDDTLTLQKQWELVDWMNFFASSFDSFTLTASCFLLLTFRNQMLAACFSFAA